MCIINLARLSRRLLVRVRSSNTNHALPVPPRKPRLLNVTVLESRDQTGSLLNASLVPLLGGVGADPLHDLGALIGDPLILWGDAFPADQVGSEPGSGNTRVAVPPTGGGAGGLALAPQAVASGANNPIWSVVTPGRFRDFTGELSPGIPVAPPVYVLPAGTNPQQPGQGGGGAAGAPNGPATPSKPADDTALSGIAAPSTPLPGAVNMPPTPANTASSSATMTAAPSAAAPQSFVQNEDTSPGVYSTTHDTALTVTADQGVLADMSSESGGTLTAELVSDVSNGTLDLSSDGSFTYTPDAGFVGEDSFDYEVFDGDTSLGVQTAYIGVENVAPYSYGQDYSVLHDQVLTGQLDGEDDDGDALTFAVTQQPATGTLTFDAQTGDFTYTPQSHTTGTVTFQYTASDGIDTSDPDTVTIEVTDNAPDAAACAFSVTHDQVLDGNAFGTGRDLDPDETLTAVLVSGPSDGTLDFQPDGSFTYTPTAHFVGEDTFWFALTDGTLQGDPMPATISVINHAPLAPATEAGGVADFNTGEITATGQIAGVDEDGDPLTPTVVDGPSSGTLTLNPDGSFTYVTPLPGPGLDSFTYRVSDGVATSDVGTVLLNFLTGPTDPAVPVAWGTAGSTPHDTPLEESLQENMGDGGHTVIASEPAHGAVSLVTSYYPDGTEATSNFVYTPNPGFVGVDSFTYSAGGNTAPVIISVLDNAPVRRADAYVMDEAGTLAGDVEDNDDDPDSSSMTAAAGAVPAHGDLQFNTDGTFLYIPNPGFVGLDTFTYGLTYHTLMTLQVTVFLSVWKLDPHGFLKIADGGEKDSAATFPDIADELNWVKPSKQLKTGAVTVANLNDTDADGIPDVDDTSIVPVTVGPLPQGQFFGRPERDMMQIAFKKPSFGPNDPPPETKLRLVVTGDGKLWWPTVSPDGTFKDRQSKQGGAFPDEIDYGFFAQKNTEWGFVYLEATKATGMQGITVEYQYKLPGGEWKPFPEIEGKVSATGVWVTKQAVNTSDAPGTIDSLPATMNGELKKQIMGAQAANGSLFGAGAFLHKPSATGPKPFMWGGRILLDFLVAPAEAGELMKFDVTRQIRSTTSVLKYGAASWEDNTLPGTYQFPAYAEGVNDDEDAGDEADDPRGVAAGHLYSFDMPGLKLYKATSDMAFLAMTSDFREFVRATPNSRQWTINVPGAVAPQGSRASDVVPWHVTAFVRATNWPSRNWGSRLILAEFTLSA